MWKRSTWHIVTLWEKPWQVAGVGDATSTLRLFCSLFRLQVSGMLGIAMVSAPFWGDPHQEVGATPKPNANANHKPMYRKDLISTLILSGAFHIKRRRGTAADVIVRLRVRGLGIRKEWTCMLMLLLLLLLLLYYHCYWVSSSSFCSTSYTSSYFWHCMVIITIPFRRYERI